MIKNVFLTERCCGKSFLNKKFPDKFLDLDFLLAVLNKKEKFVLDILNFLSNTNYNPEIIKMFNVESFLELQKINFDTSKFEIKGIILRKSIIETEALYNARELRNFKVIRKKVIDEYKIKFPKLLQKAKKISEHYKIDIYYLKPKEFLYDYFYNRFFKQ